MKTALAAAGQDIDNQKHYSMNRPKGATVDATATSNSPFDLHWRLFGIDFRVRPMFWLVNLLFGWTFLAWLI